MFRLFRDTSALKRLLSSPANYGHFRLLATETGSSSPRTSFAYCVEQVRSYDYENYVWAVQLPKELRAAVITLRAFNVETAQIADQVRETGLVPIRFQWWRDAVNSCYKGTPVNHPVVQALAQVIAEKSLTRYRLQQIINTREQDLLEPSQPQAIAELEAYAEGTATQLLFLQLEAAGVKESDALHAASHLGKAIGVTTLLRGTAHHAQRRRCYLPKSVCDAEGVTEEAIFAGETSAAMRNVALQVATVAKGHLDEARAMQAKMPPAARPLLLSSVACNLYLQALESSDFNLFSPALQKGGYSPLRYQLQIKWHVMRGKY